MLDSQPGFPTVTASVDGVGTTQVEVVNAPAPLALGNGGNAVTYALGGAPVAVDPALTVSDSASQTLVSATVALTTGLDPGDVLSAAATPGVTATYANGTLTLSGTAPVAAYQAALQSVVFSGTSAAGGTRSLLWTVTDGFEHSVRGDHDRLHGAAGSAGRRGGRGGNGQATVTFGAPAADGGTLITVYTVTAVPGGTSATGTNSPITVGGLANGTTYTFTVTASNAAGTGPPSTLSNAVVPAAASGSGGGGAAVPPATVPGPGRHATHAARPSVRGVAGPCPSNARRHGGHPGLHPVRLGMKHAAITFTVRASRAARLAVTLRDLRGRTLATWLRILKEGTQKLSLPLVPRVQHGGKRRLRLVWAGGGPETLSVTLRPRCSSQRCPRAAP